MVLPDRCAITLTERLAMSTRLQQNERKMSNWLQQMRASAYRADIFLLRGFFCRELGRALDGLNNFLGVVVNIFPAISRNQAAMLRIYMI